MEPLILVFDCGTQSIRAMLFDKKGNLVAKKKINYQAYYSREKNYAEQDMDVYIENICKASLELKKEFPNEWENIAGVTVTTMRDTTIFVDKDYKLLRPVLVWLDKRFARDDYPFPVSRTILYKLVKMYDVAKTQRSIMKTNWIRENEKDIWEKTYKIAFISAYFNYFFTGKFVDSTANTAGHLPFDFKNKKWLTKKSMNYYVYNTPPELMVDLKEPGTVIGSITKEASEKTGIKQGIPFILGGGDKCCESIGTGCLDEKSAALSFGTAATVEINTKKYVEPQKFMPAYVSLRPGYYCPELQVYRGYWLITWFKEQFAQIEVEEAKKLNIPAEDLLDKMLSRVPPGSDGLILQPYWSPDLKIPEAKGSIIGFSDVHTRAHIYRAIIEGIGYALKEGMENIEKKLPHKVERITVSGGGSQSNSICQITADMFGLPVYRVQTYETSGLGVAMLAFVSIGEFSDLEEAVKNMVKYTDEFKPNKQATKIYNELFNRVYKNLYKSLRGLYFELKDIISLPY